MSHPDNDMTFLTGWGRFPVVHARGSRPATRAAALTALTTVNGTVNGAVNGAEASPAPPRAIPGGLPRGMGRSYGDASLPAPGHGFLDARGLDRFLAFDPDTGVLEAEGGVTLHAVLAAFVPRGWFLPVTPGTQWVTLGGAVASNVHGKNHHHAGSIERFVERLEVATPTGVFTCTATECSDLFRATVGGYGLTGLITRVALRLKRIGSPRMRVRAVRAGSLAELFEAFRAHDATHEYSVAWIDTLARGRALGRGVLHLGDHAAHTEQRAEQRAEMDGPSPGSARERGHRAGGTERTERTVGTARLRVPFAPPGGLLHPLALRAFNAAYYQLHRLPRSGSVHGAGYAGFFYPLDGIGNWNLLYGPRGFFQYQFVLPDGPDATDGGARRGEDGVEECLRFLADNGMGSFLAVLKRCGDDTVQLPFCKRGYTLALDIPNRGDDTLRKLERLDALVLKHGGRVYLTKDARLPRETFRAMYPEWNTWMDVVRRYNPHGTGRSRLSERLGLWER